MAKVLNTTKSVVSIPALGLDVEPGAEFDAPDEIAAELVARPGFAEPPKPKATPAAKTKAAPAKED